MTQDNLIAFQAQETAAPFQDALSEVRQGARQTIAQAVEAELHVKCQTTWRRDDRGVGGNWIENEL